MSVQMVQEHIVLMMLRDNEVDTSETVHSDPAETLWGLIVCKDTTRQMYSNLERILFIGSFLWFFHWSVEVSEVILKAF
jgi:hypothetical protein